MRILLCLLGLFQSGSLICQHQLDVEWVSAVQTNGWLGRHELMVCSDKLIHIFETNSPDITIDNEVYQGAEGTYIGFAAYTFSGELSDYKIISSPDGANVNYKLSTTNGENTWLLVTTTGDMYFSANDSILDFEESKMVLMELNNEMALVRHMSFSYDSLIISSLNYMEDGNLLLVANNLGTESSFLGAALTHGPAILIIDSSLNTVLQIEADYQSSNWYIYDYPSFVSNSAIEDNDGNILASYIVTDTLILNDIIFATDTCISIDPYSLDTTIIGGISTVYVKYDHFGNMIWYREISSCSHVIACDIVSGPDNSLLASGTFYSGYTVLLDGIPIEEVLSPYEEYCFNLLFDTDGNLHGKNEYPSNYSRPTTPLHLGDSILIYGQAEILHNGFYPVLNVPVAATFDTALVRFNGGEVSCDPYAILYAEGIVRNMVFNEQEFFFQLETDCAKFIDSTFNLQEPYTRMFLIGSLGDGLFEPVDTLPQPIPDTEFTIFPNPARGQLCFISGNPVAVDYFKCFSSTGIDIPISFDKITGSYYIIDVSALASGIYLLEAVFTNGLSKSYRIVIH